METPQTETVQTVEESVPEVQGLEPVQVIEPVFATEGDVSDVPERQLVEFKISAPTYIGEPEEPQMESTTLEIAPKEMPQQEVVIKKRTLKRQLSEKSVEIIDKGIEYMYECIMKAVEQQRELTVVEKEVLSVMEVSNLKVFIQQTRPELTPKFEAVEMMLIQEQQKALEEVEIVPEMETPAETGETTVTTQQVTLEGGVQRTVTTTKTTKTTQKISKVTTSAGEVIEETHEEPVTEVYEQTVQMTPEQTMDVAELRPASPTMETIVTETKTVEEESMAPMLTAEQMMQMTPEELTQLTQTTSEQPQVEEIQPEPTQQVEQQPASVIYTSEQLMQMTPEELTQLTQPAQETPTVQEITIEAQQPVQQQEMTMMLTSEQLMQMTPEELTQLTMTTTEQPQVEEVTTQETTTTTVQEKTVMMTGEQTVETTTEVTSQVIELSPEAPQIQEVISEEPTQPQYTMPIQEVMPAQQEGSYKLHIYENAIYTSLLRYLRRNILLVNSLKKRQYTRTY